MMIPVYNIIYLIFISIMTLALVCVNIRRLRLHKWIDVRDAVLVDIVILLMGWLIYLIITTYL